MKKLLSLLLAVLMVAALVPAVTLPAFAAGEKTTTYVVYDQDFDAIDAGTTGLSLLEALGWYVPESKEATDAATYSIVDNGGNKVLRVNTLKAASESFIDIFSGDAMAILRNTDFKLSYRLTYREDTTNADGYSAVIYNYNDMDGAIADSTGNEAYGLAAVRMCGTGVNGVYYPAASASGCKDHCDGKLHAHCELHSLEKQVGFPNVMANRYDTVSNQPSLYSRLTGAEESADTIRKGTAVMANRVLNIELVYNYEQGVSVWINGQLVSESVHSSDYNTQIRNADLWNDFLTRNDASILAILTQPGVVADIDNIQVSTTSAEAASISSELPALLITEICGAPYKSSSSDYQWAEYIELYNPTDKPVDVANYSIIRSKNFANGTAIDPIAGNRKQNYENYINLGSVLGQNQKSSAFYLSKVQIESLPSHTYEYADNKTYDKVGNSYVEATGDTGSSRKIYYIDNWNTRYERGSADYNTNTMLNPGETMVVHFKEAGYQNAWMNLTNDGDLSQKIAGKGFRYIYRNYGVTEDVKVIVVSGFNIADAANYTFYVGAAKDENDKEINYKTLPASDLGHIESYVDWMPGIATGNMNTDTNTAATTFGNTAIQQNGYSGAYIYGVDASSDFRKGTLYSTLNPTRATGAHVGKQAGYQEILIGNFYKRTSQNPALMITEIIPNTNNLAGEAKNAFSAIELTNTSGRSVNVYDYALVRTPLDKACTTGTGFTMATPMRAGNPVDRVTGNGAYYYFAKDHINNPAECVLEPGETMVVWFLTSDTYDSYNADLDFGVNYFRQYWADNGSPELALKNADGNYAVKVVAVDGCDAASDNAERANVVFSPSATGSAVYGVADATDSVLEGDVTIDDVRSVAYLGLSSTYYEIEKRGVEDSSGTGDIIYANILASDRITPNMGMRYLTGLSYSNRISAMKQSLKVLDQSYSGSRPKTSKDPDQVLTIVLETSNALQPAGLGVLEGEEVYGIKHTLFLGVETNEGTDYYYFDARRAGITTLDKASVSMSGSSSMRFYNAVRKDVYSALVTAYGADNVKIGMLIVDSALLSDDAVFTKDGLANVAYKEVAGSLAYYTDQFAVFGSAIDLAAGENTKEFTAVGYLEVTTADGKTHTYWSATAANTSAAAVAQAAINDTSYDQSDVYCNAFGAKFSPYTQEQLYALNTYRS